MPRIGFCNVTCQIDAFAQRYWTAASTTAFLVLAEVQKQFGGFLSVLID